MNVKFVIPGRALARARNPYSLQGLWIPGLRQEAHPGMTAFVIGRYPSICVSPSTAIACPEIVLPRGLQMNRIWSAICCGVTYSLIEV